MRFRCESCNAQYAIADEKLGKKGVRVRCKKCGEIITVRPPEETPEAEARPDEDPAADAPAQDEREQTAVDNPHQAAGAESAPAEDEDGFNLGEDSELNSALDDILGGDGDGFGEDEGSGEDENLDRQATRVFNVEEMQQVQAEREHAHEEPDEEDAPAAAAEEAEFGSGDADREPVAPAGPSDVDRDRVEWYAAVDEEQVGPFSLAEFQERWERGEFGTDTLVWKTGFEDWLPVYEVPALAFLAEESPASEDEEEDEWSDSGDAADEWDQSAAAALAGESVEADETEHDADEDEDDDSGAYDDDDDDYYDDDDESSASASADAFAGADVNWKPSALSSLSATAEEELSALRPEEPEPEPDFGDGDLPFDSEDDLPSEAEAGLGDEDMEDGDSSLISQIAAEEEAAAKQEEEERQAREREAEEKRRQEEEAALAAQEAASREKREEQRDKVLPPEERYIPPHTSLPKWAIGLMVGGGLLLLVLVGFLGFFLYRLSSTPAELPVNAIAQPVTPPVQPGAQPPAQPGVQPGAQPGAQPDAQPDAQAVPVDGGTEPIKAAAVVPSDAAKPAGEGDKPKVDQAPAEPKKDAERDKPKARRKKRHSNPKPPHRVAKVDKKPDPPPPKEEPKPPVRHKPKGGILDFEDPDDRAFARETGVKAKPPAAEKKKVELPPLSKAAIFAVMKQHLEEFKACNRKQKERDASVNGRMVVSFTISPDGNVAKTGIKTSQFKSTYVAGCITGIIKRLKFPKFGGGPKTIPFPFTVK